ncbi:MAG: NAD(+) diphosphatase, partial [Ignavibacteriaceae bacterium]
MKSSNYFSIDDMNRMSEFRTNYEHISKLLKSSDSLFIPVYNQKNLITLKPDTRAVFVEYEKIKELLNYDIIFLGKYENKYYFTLDIKEENNFIKDSSSKFEDLRKIAPLLNKKEAALLAYAKGITYWRERVKFCGKCGHETVLEDSGHKAFCPKCKSIYFPQTDPAIIVIVTYGGKCLLARQALWPPKRYSVIAGFVEPGESLENTVAREVLEETGLIVKNITYHSSQPWPFPGSMMVGFTAEAETVSITLHDKELEDAKWFSRNEIIERVKLKEMKLSPEISI